MIKKRLIPNVILLGFLVLSLADTCVAESTQSKIDAGMSNYNEQEYDKAAQRFLEAQIDEPDNVALAYNRANSNYKAGKFAQAVQGYGRVAAHGGNPTLQQKAFYNIGNSLFRLGKLEEAVGAYKKALELDSADMDAKFNLEFTREKLKKQQQKEKEKQDSSANKDEQSSSDSQGQDESADQEKSEDQDEDTKKDPAEQNAKPPENREQSQSGNSTTAQNREISKEEAEQWLRSLKEDLKKFSQKQIREHAPNPGYKGKDW